MNDRLEQLISAQVKRSPDARAVVSETGSITYSQLEHQSNRLANALLAKGLQPGSRVCFLLPKSIEAIISIVAILKTGCTYVPLDPMSPASRLASVFKKVESSWLISGFDLAPLVAQSLSDIDTASIPRVCWLSDVPDSIKQFTFVSQHEIDAAGNELPHHQVMPGNLAYIIFTSGTTGQPKGVAITHTNVINYLNWANVQFPIGADDKISCHPPLHFDISVWDIFGTLTSGSELHLIPSRLSLLPQLVAKFIRDSGITQWKSVPSILVSVANRDMVVQGDFPQLRRLMWGGEAFPVASLQYWMKRLPHVQFTNSYGPTEATIGCCFYTLDKIPEDASVPVPIGKAVAGNELMVLDSAQQKVGANEIGDLYISGPGLSPGYWNDDDLTAAAFHEIPAGSGVRWYRTGDLAKVDASGIFHFCGRSDRQIKSRGYRIELDDVAVAISRVPGIAESAVVSIASEGFEGNQICVVYVLKVGVILDVMAIKTALTASLPFYMLPKLWMELDNLPKSPTGKIDHNRIEQLFITNKNILPHA